MTEKTLAYFKTTFRNEPIPAYCLITDSYVDYFTNEHSNFDYIQPVPGKQSYDYPPIMNDFKNDLWYIIVKMFGRMATPFTWAWCQMLEKYSIQGSSVYPDDAYELIEHADTFTLHETIAFLYICVMYKERFNDALFSIYAKDGLIGRALLRLKAILTEEDAGADPAVVQMKITEARKVRQKEWPS